MTVKTLFAHDDFVRILSLYNLGDFVRAEAMQQGTVQTNFLVQTTQGTYVLRYYENRSEGSVLFESDLLAYLSQRRYPCPEAIRNSQGRFVSLYRNKPYMIFGFVRGRHIEHPGAHHWRQLIQRAAELQRLTLDFHSPHTAHRWNYGPDLCQRLAHAAAKRIDTPGAQEKYAWLAHQLSALELPPALPKGICHCDFHFSNVLFQGDEFVALLDFDDANHTFLTFDLVGLIEYWAWPDGAGTLDLARARSVVREYDSHRPLSAIEQQHLYDVYKLSILLDCVWYFDRGAGAGFRERKKIEALADLGRQRFAAALFRLAEPPTGTPKARPG